MVVVVDDVVVVAVVSADVVVVAGVVLVVVPDMVAVSGSILGGSHSWRSFKKSAGPGRSSGGLEL